MRKANLSQLAAELNTLRAADKSTSDREPEPIRQALGSAGSPQLGPRGGSTTITPGGLFRTTAYFTSEERSALRKLAREREQSFAELIREAVRRYLGLQ